MTSEQFHADLRAGKLTVNDALRFHGKPEMPRQLDAKE